MLLTVDIGNTNITFGVFEGKKLTSTFRVSTLQKRTSDEYGMVMCELLEHNQVGWIPSRTRSWHRLCRMSCIRSPAH